MRSVALVLALFGLTACSTSTLGDFSVATPPEYNGCRAQTDVVLAELGIPAAAVESFFNMPRRASTRRPNGESDDRIIGHSNWLRLNSCDGSAVLVFNRVCQFRRAFTTGDCRLPDQT